MRLTVLLGMRTGRGERRNPAYVARTHENRNTVIHVFNPFSKIATQRDNTQLHQKRQETAMKMPQVTTHQSINEEDVRTALRILNEVPLIGMR